LILYLDTSALVKLYVRELGSARVRRAVTKAEQVGTSRVAYPEARAAFARRSREGMLGARALRRAVAALEADLPSLVVVECGGSLARRAGELAERRALRGFDAIHLASALDLRDLSGGEVRFLAFDDRLNAGAMAEGLAFPR
jgi:predicted nucleic acid-binding protein